MDAAPLATHSQPTLRIFVGCTSVDLQRHRHAARHLIEKFDEHAVVMEDFGAQDGDATQVSLAEVASADVYILLLAWRYGTIPTVPPNLSLSVTHLEYRAARAAGKPCLIFLADPATEADDGPGAPFPATVPRQRTRRAGARFSATKWGVIASPPSLRRRRARRWRSQWRCIASCARSPPISPARQ